MQTKNDDKKFQLKLALSKVVKNLHLKTKKSLFLFSSENDISMSVLSMIERAQKDPQLSTIFKLAEAFDIEPSKFIKLVSQELPQDFHFIDK